MSYWGAIVEIEPEEPWERPALALEADLWASLYRPEVDVAALARRAVAVAAAFGDPGEEEPSPAPDTEFQPDEREIEARQWADARATDPAGGAQLR